MEPIKILTFGLPKILQGIVAESFRKYGTLDVLGHYGTIEEYFTDSGKDYFPNIIIVDSKQSDQCPDVLYQYPKARVVSIETQGKYFSVWRMVPDKTDLGEITSDELAEVLCVFDGESY